MAIRQPNIAPPILGGIDALIWHRLQCELVTPLYGGGVESAKVDEKMPIRAASIRGQLRFWWRLLAKYKWKLGTAKQIQAAEFRLWGGMTNSDSAGQASQVFLKVSDLPKVHKNSLISYEDVPLPYVLFPAANAKDKDTNPHMLLKAEGMQWQLHFAFSSQLQADLLRQQQVIETIKWWANFGGLGFRSRKGLGAVHVSQCEDYPEICDRLTETEIQQAGCLIAKRGAQSDAFSALKAAVEKLSDFRQKANVGRNPGQKPKPAGRSRWPEPDALRRIQKTYAPEHAPEHAAGNIFPRAMFGLPIILHFVGIGRGEPRDENIMPSHGDRLASPLILRPCYAGEKNGVKQWEPMALVLPHEHILDMQVKVNGGQYPIWNKQAAALIRPIQENSGDNPLQAFLTYFKK